MRLVKRKGTHSFSGQNTHENTYNSLLTPFLLYRFRTFVLNTTEKQKNGWLNFKNC